MPAELQPPSDEGPTRPLTLLLRLTGEITTKGRRTRSRFQRVLAENLRDACRSEGFPVELREEWSRLYLRTAGSEALDPVGRVFGLSSFSPIEAECEASLAEIVRSGAELWSERVRGRTFAVRARRSGRHPFRSADVMRELGAALLPGAAGVDLDAPEVEVRVEVRDERAWLFSRRMAGAGGLPAGVEGRAVVLLSGGFDSAVAAWMLLRRGVALDYVFCNLAGAAYRRMVVEVAKLLADRWSYGMRPRLFVVGFEEVVEELQARVRPALLQLALKRQMYRAADALAERVGGDAVVTGEAVGQVSSQTLPNLRAIHGASARPVLRPLVGVDKEEIVARSRRIGTYELSARVREYCAIARGRPATAARPERLEEEERSLDPAPLRRALEDVEVVDLRALDPAALAAASVIAEEVPDGAEVVDTRDADAYETWHWPGARHLPFDALRSEFHDLDRERTWLLYCEVGVKSAQLAEWMQEAGYEAYGFRGGVRGLRRLQAESEAARRGGAG